MNAANAESERTIAKLEARIAELETDIAREENGDDINIDAKNLPKFIVNVTSTKRGKQKTETYECKDDDIEVKIVGIRSRKKGDIYTIPVNKGVIFTITDTTTNEVKTYEPIKNPMIILVNKLT